MTKKIILALFSLVSLTLATLLILFIGETLLRSKEKGLDGALKSYFIVEVPKSNIANDSWIISDAELGYRRNPNMADVNEYSMIDHEITMPKPTGVKRIVVLGDSIPCTGNPTFVDLLKEKFKNDPSIEIINASTPGYTNYQELVFLKKYITKIDPDLVILGYVLNDNHKFLHVFDQKNNMLWSKEAQNSLNIDSKLDAVIDKSFFLTYVKVMLVERKKEGMLKKPGLWWNEAIDFNTAWKNETWSDIDHQVQAMQSVLHEQGAQLAIINFPLQSQLSHYASTSPPANSSLAIDYAQTVLKPQRNIMAVSKKHSIPNLDLFPSFYDSTQAVGEDLYTDGLHLSTAGHQVTADKVYPFIFDIMKK